VRQPTSPFSSPSSAYPQETVNNSNIGQRTVSAYSTTPDQIWVPKKQSEAAEKESQVQDEEEEDGREKEETTKQKGDVVASTQPTTTQYQSRPPRSSYHGPRPYSSNFGSPQRGFHATVGYETQNTRHSSYQGAGRGNAHNSSFYASGGGHAQQHPPQHWQQVQHQQQQHQQYRPRTEWKEKGTNTHN